MSWVKIAVGASALVSAFIAGWYVNGWRMGAEIAEIRRTAAADQIKATYQARAEEQRRVAAQTEIANEAVRQLREAQQSARTADAARRELLARVTALVNASRRPGDPAAVAAGTATGDPVILLADVLGRADQRAGELAQYADAARIAGQKCERDYDALTLR